MDEPIDKDIRGATNLRIKFRSANLDEFIDRYAVDISRGGIFIRTREPLSVNSRLKLDFQLLDAQPLLEGEGSVVWIRQPDPARPEVTPGMGVRFDKLTPDSQARLDKILSEKDRLSQAGKAPGMSKSGGVAVRRPTGTVAPLDGAGGVRRQTGAMSSLEGAGAKSVVPKSPPPQTPAASPGPQTAAAPPRPPTTPEAKNAPAPPRLTGAGMSTGSGSPLRAAPPATGFGRPRTTTGAMNTRSAPVPSSLFEPPTADDIDRALAVLEDKPGPIPPMAPPPKIVPAVPIAVADDASNEPTRVVSDPQEFGMHEAVTGKGASIVPEAGAPDAPLPIGDDLTAPASLDEDGTMATIAASPAAFAAAERALGGAASATTERKSASALDAVVPGPDGPAGTAKPPSPPPPAPLPGPLRRKSAIVEAASSSTESGRFRTNATYRRPRTALKRAVAIAVIAAAGGGAAFALRHRLAAMLTSPEVATKPAPAPTPAPQPTPSAAADAGVTGAAADAALAAAPPGGPAGAMGPAPAPEAAKGTEAAGAKPEPEAAKPAPTESKPAAEAVHPKRKRPRPAAAEGEEAKPQATPEAAKAEAGGVETTKGEAAKPEGTKAAERPAGETGEAKPAAEGAAAAAAPAAEVATAPATLKITSTPGGAEVIIDGISMGTTPFSSKDVDPMSAHAITIKKDGFEAQERAIGVANWQHPRSGPLLKVSVKLKRTAADAPKAEPKEAKPDVEIITPD